MIGLSCKCIIGARQIRNSEIANLKSPMETLQIVKWQIEVIDGLLETRHT
jgi:hypothetical protein